jgi:tetratricopeptide (TPR) repeat protein
MRYRDDMNEETIDSIERLKEAGDFDEAIHQILGGIDSATSDIERARYLINLIVCATNIGNETMAGSSIRDLFKLPLPADIALVRNYVSAVSYIDFFHPQRAVELLRANLSSDLLMDQAFFMQRYETLAQYGFALTHLERYSEALSSLNVAESAVPNGDLTANIRLYKATCLASLRRFDDAYVLAEGLICDGTAEIAIEAKFIMAQVRLAQGHFKEAVDLYRDVRKLLPSTRVSEIEVKGGIEAAMAGLTRDSKSVQ